MGSDLRFHYLLIINCQGAQSPARSARTCAVRPNEENKALAQSGRNENQTSVIASRLDLIVLWSFNLIRLWSLSVMSSRLFLGHQKATRNGGTLSGKERWYNNLWRTVFYNVDKAKTLSTGRLRRRSPMII
jgi:hypothetical protein